MPNGKNMNEQLQFREHLQKMNPEEKIDFIASEVYFMRDTLSKLPCRNGECSEGRINIKQRAGIASGVAAGIYLIVEAVLRRLG